MDIMYLVEGDTFTFLSGGSQTISEAGASAGDTGWNSEVEPRAMCELSMDGYDGTASLLWNDAVVDEFKIDQSFLASDRVEVLAYDDPDGTRVEYHLYAQPECGAWPNKFATRAEVEALER